MTCNARMLTSVETRLISFFARRSFGHALSCCPLPVVVAVATASVLYRMDCKRAAYYAPAHGCLRTVFEEFLLAVFFTLEFRVVPPFTVIRHVCTSILHCVS